MTKSCKDCVYYSAARMACFNDFYEGMRIFNPEKSVCKFYRIK